MAKIVKKLKPPISHPPINLDALLGKAGNKIHAVGIELEGRWDQGHVAAGSIKRDGSVNFQGEVARFDPANMTPSETAFVSAHQANRRAQGRIPLTNGDIAQLLGRENRSVAPAGYVGEVASPVLKLADWHGWIKKYYPSAVNQSCGLHIHQSFRTAYLYQTLATPSYCSTLVEYLQRWGKRVKLPDDHCFWDRLAGKSQFARNEFHADFQMQQTGHSHRNAADAAKGTPSRYTMVNYTWRMFQTVEIRVLPMFEDLATSVSALEECINITNAFLAAMNSNKRKQVVEVEFDEPVFVNEIHVQC